MERETAPWYGKFVREIEEVRTHGGMDYEMFFEEGKRGLDIYSIRTISKTKVDKKEH